jgi:hypothetical protein
MMSVLVRRIGIWGGIFFVILGFVYIGLIAVMVLFGSGFPPVEPYQTIFNILILITAAWMVFYWTVLHQAVQGEKKLFSLASLVMIVIFATLTSINRYVALTVVRQSILSGNTTGLEWFLPYGWPSVMLALEILGWGFFFGLACLCLAPVFTDGKLERAIFWGLIVTGILSLSAALGQVIETSTLNFNPFTMAGSVAWGPGLTTVAILIVIWFLKADIQPSKTSS